MGFDFKGGVVQNSKSINNVSTDIGVNILWLVLSDSGTVPGPVGEVAHNFIVTRGRVGRDLHWLGWGKDRSLCGGGGRTSGLNDKIGVLSKPESTVCADGILNR